MIREFELFSHWLFVSFAPGSIPRSKYNALKSIHGISGQCFHLLANIEALVLEQMVVDWSRVNFLTSELIAAIRILVDQLQAIHPVEFMDAQEWLSKISFYTNLATDRLVLEGTPPFLYSLASQENRPQSLQKLPHCLCTSKKLQGFITTPALFQYFVEANDLRHSLNAILQTLDITSLPSLRKCQQQSQELITAGSLPQSIVNDLEVTAFDLAGHGEKIDVWTFVGNSKHWQPVAVQHQIMPADIFITWKNAVAGKYTPYALGHRLSQALTDEEEGVLVYVVPSNAPKPDCFVPQNMKADIDPKKLHQRLAQVLPLVTDLHVFQAEGEPLRPEHCRSLHDLVCLCLEQGLAGIFAFAGQPSRGLAGIKQIRLEVPVIINSFNLGGGLFPSAAEKTTISLDDIRSVPAWSFLQGLVNPTVLWPGLKNEEETSPPHYSSYAIVDQFFAHCTLRLGSNLYTVECCCDDDQSKYVHFRFKGSGHLPENLIRRHILAQILEEEGFTVKVCGDYLDAVRCAKMDVYLQRSLVCLGLLVAWIHSTPLASMLAMGEKHGLKTFRTIRKKALLPSL